MKIAVYVLLLLSLLNFSNAKEKFDGNKLIKAELISKHTEIEAGKSTILAIRLIVEKGWHTYWENPGDSGMPTKVKWDSLEAFEYGSLQYPIPKKIVDMDMGTFGLHDTIYLFLDFKAKENAKQGTYKIKGKVDWLVCKEICLPGSADIELSIKISERNLFNLNAKNVAEYLDSYIIPSRKPLPNIKADKEKNTVHIKMKNDSYFLGFKSNEDKLEFYPSINGFFSNYKEQELQILKAGLKLIVPLDEFREKDPSNLEGILVRTRKSNGHKEAYYVNLEIKK